jgi:hypothetical protein
MRLDFLWLTKNPFNECPSEIHLDRAENTSGAGDNPKGRTHNWNRWPLQPKRKNFFADGWIGTWK